MNQSFPTSLRPAGRFDSSDLDNHIAAHEEHNVITVHCGIAMRGNEFNAFAQTNWKIITGAHQPTMFITEIEVAKMAASCDIDL